MATEQASSSSWPVVFTEDSPIDVVKAVSRDQSVSTGRTRKALTETTRTGYHKMTALYSVNQVIINITVYSL